ncbi:hypothetical protein ACOMHN_002002 [Nucella lapillus]
MTEYPYHTKRCKGVQADGTLTALIVSSCVSGLILLLVILGSIIYCVIRYQRKQDYLHKASGPLTNGHYRPMGVGGAARPHLSPEDRRAKAYTQHSALPRHRPPLNFYTLRADPRDVGLTPPQGGPFSMGGGGFVTAPPNFGQPVLYLDMLDTVTGGPQRNGVAGNGFLRRYIPNDATPPEYFYAANGNAESHHARGGESAEEQEFSDERYRRKEQKNSRGRSKSRSRGGSTPSHHDRSRSRSRDAVSSKRKSGKSPQQTPEEAPILSIPGDIILADSNMTRDSVPLTQEAITRSLSQPHLDSEGRVFATTTLQNHRYTLTFDHDTDQEYDDLQRSDIYFLPSSRSEDPFEMPLMDTHQSVPGILPPGSSHFIPVSDFPPRPHRQESYSDPEPTPREDYMESLNLPPGSHFLPTVGRQISGSEPETVPAPFYSARPVVGTDTQVFTYAERGQMYPATMDERDYRHSFEAMLNYVNPHSEAARRQRPPTPPFDGETSPRDSITSELPRPTYLGDLNSREAGRIPTPPPDIPSPMDDDDDDDDKDEDSVDGRGRFVAMKMARPPTPPPGKILRPKEEELDILQDLQDLQDSLTAKRLKASSQTSLPDLPFMAELKRRQRDPEDSDDEDDLSHTPHHHHHTTTTSAVASPEQVRGFNSSRALDAVLSLDLESVTRGQVVSFATEPPEIIPSSQPTTPGGTAPPSTQEFHSHPSTSAFAPPPLLLPPSLQSPPPPPPIPPPPPLPVFK